MRRVTASLSFLSGAASLELAGRCGGGSWVGVVLGGMSCCGLAEGFFLLCPPGVKLLLGHTPVVGWPGESATWSRGLPCSLPSRGAACHSVVLVLTNVLN